MTTLSRLRNAAFALLAIGAFIGAGSIASSSDAEARGSRGGGFRTAIGVGVGIGIGLGVVRPGFARHGLYRPGLHRPGFQHRHHGYRPVIARRAFIAPVVVTPSCYTVRRINAYGELVRIPVCS